MKSCGFIFLPINIGRTDWPSTLAGTFDLAWARSAAVGRKSQNAHGKSLTWPGLMAPVHRTIMGTRIPPSYRSRFMPRNGPALLKNVGSTPPSLCGPLSLVKKMMVFVSSL
jgi:hypothetical protein